MAKMHLTTNTGSAIFQTVEHTDGFNVTINGKTVVVGAQTVINDTDTAPTLAVEPSYHYVYTQPLTSLTLSSIPESAVEASVYFTTANTFSIDIPDSVKFFGAPPAFNTGKTYMLMIKYGVMGVGIVFSEN